MSGGRTGLAVLAVVLLAGCPPVGGGGGDGSGMLQTDRYADNADADGLFEVTIDVGNDVTSFQMTGASDDYYIALEELYDPDGQRVLNWRDWYYSPYSLTSAIYGFTKITAFDWPVRDVDGPLKPGRWRAVWDVLDEDFNYMPRAPVDVATATKTDGNFDQGTFSVRVVWARGVDDDPAVVAAIEQAVEVWREIWGNYGVVLDERYVDSDLSPNLNFAFTADDPEVGDLSQSKRPNELQLIVGDQINNSGSLYGVAAAIPGTIEATDATYVTLAWITHAGRDGAFDDGEIRLMGETMAHETSHYSGLFHPVEGDYYYFDALADTPECATRTTCENQLATNLMYPFSVCSGGSCVLAELLTDDQTAELQQYIGAL